MQFKERKSDRSKTMIGRSWRMNFERGLDSGETPLQNVATWRV